MHATQRPNRFGNTEHVYDNCVTLLRSAIMHIFFWDNRRVIVTLKRMAFIYLQCRDCVEGPLLLCKNNLIHKL